MKRTRSYGFTLVELIVVIAIVAILSAVSIVGFIRFIDNAKWSNDSQVAVQMTNTVRNNLIGVLLDDLDAAGVRQIIEDNHGGEFNFTPETSEAGFFYLADNQQVVVRKYIDMTENELSNDHQTVLLDDRPLDVVYDFGDTPEEIFGDGKFLLTTEGSAVAELVTTIRNYYRLVIEEGKDETYLDAIASKNESLKDLLDAYVTNFSPTKNVLIDSTGLFDLDSFFDNPLVLSEDMNIIYPDDLSPELVPVIEAIYEYENIRQRFKTILEDDDKPDGQALFGGVRFDSGAWGSTGQSIHPDQIDFFSWQGILPADDPTNGTLYSGGRYDDLNAIRNDEDHPLNALVTEYLDDVDAYFGSITKLDLSGFNLHPWGGNLRYLLLFTGLEELDLSENGTNDQRYDYNLLPSLDSLITLDISNSHIQDFNSLFVDGAAKLSNLQTLNLSGLVMGHNYGGGAEFAADILHKFIRNDVSYNLLSINISNITHAGSVYAFGMWYSNLHLQNGDHFMKNGLTVIGQEGVYGAADVSTFTVVNSTTITSGNGCTVSDAGDTVVCP